MRDLTGGQRVVEVDGRTVEELVTGLERLYPGCAVRLCPEGDLTPELMVVVDRSAAPLRLRVPVRPDSDVAFLPSVAGG